MKKKHLNIICFAAAILILCVAVTPAAALTAQVIPPILPKGLPLSISGQTDNPGEVAVWIIGKNYEERRIITTTDGTFTEELFPPETTSGLPSGQYFLIIEDTGPDGKFALDTATDGDHTMVNYQDMPLFALDDPETMYSDTAMALSEALNRPEIDDAAMKMVFIVEEPWIRIDQTPTGHPGDLLRFAGSTNMPPGSEMSYDIYLVSANPHEGDEVAESGTIEVVKGGSQNYWYVDVDTGRLDSETYVLTLASGIHTATTTFILCDNRFTLPPTPAITVETLRDEPEVVSSQPTEPELFPADTTDYGTIATTDELIYTTDNAMIWCSAIDGDYFTWAEKTEDEETNIFLYHIPTGTTRTIVESARYLTFTMDISGDHIAWEKLHTGEPTVPRGIGLYTISTGYIEDLPVDDCTINQIAMDGDLIAFSGLDFSPLKSDDKHNVKKTIFLYSIANRTQQVLCKQPGHQIEPAIGDGYVAWRTECGGYNDTITIYSLTDRSQFTLSPPDGASYAQPSVGGGMVVAPLYYKDPETSGPYKVEIVATALPGMETTTLSLPETPHRSAPQSDGGCIFWSERYTDSSSQVMVYDIKSDTIIGTFALSGVEMDLNNNHLISTNIDEIRGVSSLWLTTFTGETTAENEAGALPASMIGFGVMAAGIVAAVVFQKRGGK
ncbi:hypothetical protein [Methanogenium organophilum]|uniref:DUF3821 domain-containing protein n=1 Tax=Methanogenium organophilum TaxID=2199 RepID=A0A9X9S1N6_METOG|nr:hypothetical protein [Methanogenium organophilum]WAI00213.1 hypothetical protein OU421_07150 [Methanogenium organophilum]